MSTRLSSAFLLGVAILMASSVLPQYLLDIVREQNGLLRGLTEFEHGKVIGCHSCQKSVREISTLLNIPSATVSAVIVKWKREGIRTAQKRTGRPRLLTDRDRRQLKMVVMCNRQTSVHTITQEFQTGSGRHLPACVVPTVKFGGGGVMVWSCFSWRGLAPLIVLRGTITAEAYIDVLCTLLLPTVEEQFGDGDCIFQHDLASVHNARLVAEGYTTVTSL